MKSILVDFNDQTYRNILYLSGLLKLNESQILTLGMQLFKELIDEVKINKKTLTFFMDGENDKIEIEEWIEKYKKSMK